MAGLLLCQPLRFVVPDPGIVIHSGGQTGVDRAALDAAMACGVPVGGWCPRGRRAEDGPIPERYPLVAMPSPDYADRTRRNVLGADATLVLTRGNPDDGTLLTVAVAQEVGKPLRAVTLDADVEPVAGWLRAEGVRVLNVAGPRESTAPGIYAEAYGFMRRLLAELGR